MASITARDVSLVFPLVGSDRRFSRRLERRGEGDGAIGGRIETGPRGGVRAIDGLNIDLRDGDRLGIYGHNGAGKTTLLRVLAGIYPPTAGHIQIDGKVSGMFSLSLGINKEISGLENITLKGLMYGLRKVDIQERVPEIVAFSELGDYIHMPVKTYSSGMELRLQFAIASALQPDILLMDEWVSTADQSFREKMDTRLEEMIDKTPIVIIASHSEGRLASWATRMIVMDKGKIVEDRDTQSDVETGPFSPKAFKPDPDGVRHYSLLMNAREREAALDLLADVWPPNLDPEGYHARKGALLLTLKRVPEAIEEYEILLSLVKGNPKYHDQYGRALAKVGAFKKAEHHLRTALKLSDGTIGHYDTLRYVMGELGCEVLITELVEEHTYGFNIVQGTV